MAQKSLLSLFLFALMAVLARGNMDIWSSACYPGAAIQNNKLTAYCKTPAMGPPWICSILDLNKCYAYDTKEGIIYAESE
jgi:hypothetical protein